MSMSNLHIYSDKDCKLKYIESLPKEPQQITGFETKGGLKFEMGGDFGYDKAMRKYQSTLQQAKDNAIPIGNEEEVKQYLVKAYSNNALKHINAKGDSIYSIEGYEVEVISKSIFHRDTNFPFAYVTWTEEKVAYIKPMQKKGYCDCSFVFIVRNPNTDIAYCGTCGHEVKEEKETQESLWWEVIDFTDKMDSSPRSVVPELMKQFIITRK
jgi:hypothetical protein